MSMNTEAIEHTLRVQRTARYHLLGAEPGTAPATVLWLFHGFGQQSAGFIRKFADAASHRTLLVAPEGLSRFYYDDWQKVGASWTTRELRDAEVSDQMDYLQAVHRHIASRYDLQASRHIFLGFSQGVSVVWRWANHAHAPLPSAIVCWAGMVTEDSRRLHTLLPKPQLLGVVGDADPFITPERQQQFNDAARAIGLPFEWLHFVGGHVVNAEMWQQLRQKLGV